MLKNASQITSQIISDNNKTNNSNDENNKHEQQESSRDLRLSGGFGEASSSARTPGGTGHLAPGA